MGVKSLFLAAFRLLFQSRNFWEEFDAGLWPDGEDAFREYAVPLVALVQLAKYPLAATPRIGMMLALSSFLVDLAALYAIAGGGVRLFSSRIGGDFRERFPAVAAYALTPAWIGELFGFVPDWSIFVVIAAVAWSMVIVVRGLGNTALNRQTVLPVLVFITMVLLVKFFVITSAMRAIT